MADYPSDVLYTKDHEWARKDGTRYRIGISRHAVDQLGDVTLVNFDVKPGSIAVEAGKAIGTVESVVKRSATCIAPMSGKLVETNNALNNSPELVNEDPYGKGWMAIIESASGEPALMDSAAYAAYVATLDH